MSRAKQGSKRKHRACAVPLLGAAGLSLSLASGASAATEVPVTGTATQNTGVSHEFTLGEEEISDVSLATFYVLTKKTPKHPGPAYNLPTAAEVGAAAAAEVAEAVATAEAAGVVATAAALEAALTPE